MLRFHKYETLAFVHMGGARVPGIMFSQRANFDNIDRFR